MKTTLILVDGMNIANRSMCAKFIARQFPPTDSELHSYEGDRTAPQYVSAMSGAIDGYAWEIIESSWKADEIMGKIGEPTKLAREHRRMLDRLALGCDVQHVICYGDNRLYAENANKIASYDKLKDAIAKIHHEWMTLPADGFIQTKVNMTGADFTQDVDIMLERMEIFAGRNKGPGIGHWNPGKVVLLVGDSHGPTTQPYHVQANIAFCDMAKPGSSFWLSQKLDLASIQEKHLYWINAFGKDEKPTDPAFIERLQPISILTLGEIAARWCRAHNLRHEPFSHPQFHKRFHHNERYKLTDRLEELTEGL